jgi:hypothetical protein
MLAERRYLPVLIPVSFLLIKMLCSPLRRASPNRRRDSSILKLIRTDTKIRVEQ